MTKEDTFNFKDLAKDVEHQVAIAAEQPGFFGELAKAVISLFGPSRDDYPATGTQPFTGEVSRKH